MTDDDRPGWARRIRSERVARGWSQADAVRGLRGQVTKPLPGEVSLLRQWKRWEAGEVEPDDFYAPLIAKLFGTVTAAIFPRPAAHDVELLAATGMDTLEVVTRLRASNVSAATVEALHITTERLACDYSSVSPEHLYVEAHAWLRRLGTLLDRRLTLAQHRELLVIGGRIALILGCVEQDMDRRQAAECSRRAALSLGRDADDLDTVGWAHEMRSWFSLTQGQYRAAVAAAEAGLAAVDQDRGVIVQLEALRAKAWARMGNRQEVTAALDHGRAVLESLPYPDNPDNHFVVDPAKFDFYTMDAYRHVGDDALAEVHAREVLRSSTGPDGTELKPMRVAEARVTLGVVAARAGDLDGALAHGRQALRGARKSLPSLSMVTRELGGVLVERYPHEPEAHLYLDELRALAA